MNKTGFIKVVNNNQFEIKAVYNSNKDIKKIDYNINIYFFIPKNLNINTSSYTKADFYSEHVSFIRLLTPKNQLGVLKKKFLTLLEKLKSDKLSQLNKKDKVVFENEMKLIVTSYTSYLRSFTTKMSKKYINIKRLYVLLNRIKEFNNIKKEFLLYAKDKPDNELINFTKISTEYMSLTSQHYLLKINIELNAHKSKYKENINEIVALINDEISFCKENNIRIISNNDLENEKVIFRYSILKKLFYAPLYLYPKRKKDGVNLKEFYYAIAAGISMIFTSIVLFATQKEYGNFTTSFFVALVVSYMFKDRIKEAYRHYFDKKIELKSYDFKEKIYNQEKTSIFAFLRERMRFISKDSISKEVKKTRLIGVPLDILSTWTLDEEILKYEKNITIYNKNIQKEYKDTVKGINNIMRFDISKFLKKMSNEKVPLYKISGNKMYGNKVYHVNIIIEFTSNKKTMYQKARIILNKKGIQRIELPEHNIKFFAKDNIKNTKNWIKFKKSGFVKKRIFKGDEEPSKKKS